MSSCASGLRLGGRLADPRGFRGPIQNGPLSRGMERSGGRMRIRQSGRVHNATTATIQPKRVVLSTAGSGGQRNT
jgi:hypothetical protein